MGYHYIALVDVDGRHGDQSSKPDQLRILNSMGMRSVDVAGRLTLFVTHETPVMVVPGGVVIGHLFSKDGEPATTEHLMKYEAESSLPDTLLTRYWGEYLLIETSAEASAPIGIMRDPSGGVPCFHRIHEGAGFITSDVSLANDLGLHDGEIDWGFIAQALAHPHLTTSRTAFVGLLELLPGAALILRDAATTLREAWRPWAFVGHPHRLHDMQQAIAAVRSSATTVVRAWAQTDRNVLVELSGGLDSSIVAMCLQNVDAKVTCCTLVTPVPGADERMYARQVAESLRLDLHVEMLGFENASFDFMPPVQTARPRMSILHHVSHAAATAAARRYGSTSFFSGGGGDTIFCYTTGAAPAADAFRERGLSAGFTAIGDLSVLHGCTHWKAGRLTLAKLVRGAKTPIRADTLFVDPAAYIPPLDRHPWFDAPATTLPGDQERIANLVGTQVYRDGAPRGSAHWLRLPLLSQPVVEACLAVPSWMWIAGGTNRAVARQAFAGQLPRGVLERRSKGSFMNYLGAAYQRGKPAIRDYLLGGQLQAHGLLDTAALNAFFACPPRPRDTTFMRILDLCMVENWLRHQR